jgi:hypothetical protein
VTKFSFITRNKAPLTEFFSKKRRMQTAGSLFGATITPSPFPLLQMDRLLGLPATSITNEVERPEPSPVFYWSLGNDGAIIDFNLLRRAHNNFYKAPPVRVQL